MQPKVCARMRGLLIEVLDALEKGVTPDILEVFKVSARMFCRGLSHVFYVTAYQSMPSRLSFKCPSRHRRNVTDFETCIQTGRRKDGSQAGLLSVAAPMMAVYVWLDCIFHFAGPSQSGKCAGLLCPCGGHRRGVVELDQEAR